MTTEFSSFSTISPVKPVTAPSWSLYASALSAALAVATCLLVLLAGTPSLAAAAAGYTLGALVVPAFTIAYRFGRQSARKSLHFVPSPTVERLVLAVLCLGILAGLANAWFVATELAKQ